MITLRQIKESDANFFLKYLKDESIAKSYKNIPEKLSLSDVKKQIKVIKRNCYAVLLDKKFIGIRSFYDKLGFIETGSWIAKTYQGKGYGRAALQLFLKKFPKGTILKSKPTNKESRDFLLSNKFNEDSNGFMAIVV